MKATADASAALAIATIARLDDCLARVSEALGYAPGALDSHVMASKIRYWRKAYLDVADALLPESNGPEQLAARARELRAIERRAIVLSADEIAEVEQLIGHDRCDCDDPICRDLQRGVAVLESIVARSRQ